MSPFLFTQYLEIFTDGITQCLGCASKVAKAKWENKVRKYRGNEIYHKELNDEAGWWEHRCLSLLFPLPFIFVRKFVRESWNKKMKLNKGKYSSPLNSVGVRDAEAPGVKNVCITFDYRVDSRTCCEYQT